MRMSDQALNYLIDTPKAREILQYLDSNGANVIGVWCLRGTPEKDFKDMIPVVGIAQVGGAFEEMYSGEEAREIIKILRELSGLGIAEACATGWCSDPITYALNGEWNWDHKEKTVSFEPVPENRKELLELIR